MRISIINYNLVAQDAIGQSILHQIRFFRRRGDVVQIYTMHPPQGIREDIAQLVQVVELVTLMEREDQHFLHSDLYVYHYPSRYPLLESIKGLDRGAVMLYYHNVTPPKLWRSSFYRHPLQHSVDSVGSFASYADLVVTPSEYNADQLVREHGCEREQIKVLPLAVPLDHFSPGVPDSVLLEEHHLFGRQVILFVGRMAGNKRIDLLVEALPSVQKQVPNALLLLVGDEQSNPAHREVVAQARARAEELGVTDDVIFTGMVPDVPPYFRLADVYATASLHEGFGVPLIEAMASGVPVVASRATAHPSVLGEAGVLVEPDNAQELAEALIRVLTDDGYRGELVQQGLVRAREFSLEQYEIGWGKIVADVTAWLPDQPIPRLRSLTAQPAPSASATSASEPSEAKKPSPPPTPTLHNLLSKAEIEQGLTQLRTSADIMTRGYNVYSKLPLVGKAIAWIRRNLTSHLREPYIDPTFERQVAFNRQMITLMQQMAQRLPGFAEQAPTHQLSFDSAGRDAHMESRLRRIEALLGLLTAQLTLLTIDKQGEVEASDVAELCQQIEALRNEIHQEFSLTRDSEQSSE